MVGPININRLASPADRGAQTTKIHSEVTIRRDPENFLRGTPMAEQKPEPSNSCSEKHVKAPNILLERAQEENENETITHTEKSPHHHKETHGTSDVIDEDTPVDEVKGPNVFERVKEEIEALVQAIHPKKKSNESSSK